MSTSEDDYTTTHAEAGEEMAAEETEDWKEFPDSDDSDEEFTGVAGKDPVDTDDEESVEEEPGTELMVSQRRESIKLTRFGGHTDRVPTQGLRGALLEKVNINVGPSIAEIIKVEMEACRELREILRRVAGALCIGFFSGKGGPGKSTMATLIAQLFFIMNPVRDRVILIDVNTSHTTIQELNGLEREDFLNGKYWTMETLWDFLDKHHKLSDLEFSEINAKLAYRSDPQIPVIPLIVESSEFEEDESKFTGEQYLLVLKVLKRFFDVIVHDFGTETKVKLTQVALAQQHMLGLLSHNGKATTELVGHHLEMLHLNMVGLLMNTVVVFNAKQKPSRATIRAIELERAGKRSRAEQILKDVNPQGKRARQIRTPGEAVAVINRFIAKRVLVDPLTVDDIVHIGFDEHLTLESKLNINEVEPAVQAQLWTLTDRLLAMRVAYEGLFLSALPEGSSIYREQMVARLDKNEPDPRKQEVIYSIDESPRRGAARPMVLSPSTT